MFKYNTVNKFLLVEFKRKVYSWLLKRFTQIPALNYLNA